MHRSINELVDAIESAATKRKLNDWAKEFLQSMRDIKFRLTDKQRAKLLEFADEAGVDVGDYLKETT
jgi:hypothetical protein